MKKKLLIALIVLVCLAVVALGLYFASEYGLFGEISYTYTVEDNTNIKVTLDTTNGYSFTNDTPFLVSKNGDTCMTGQFIYEETYEQFAVDAAEGINSVILETGTRDGFDYVFWNYNNTEFNIVMRFADTGAAIALSNTISEESARECFEHLTFQIVD